jgi:MFS family permease
MIRPFRDVAANPDLSRTELAFAAFAVTEIGIWVAMLVVAFEAGGTTAAGLVGVVQLLPTALVAPFAALPADRYRRDRVLDAVYLLTAAGVGATAAALAFDAPFALVYVLAALATVATTGVRPAQAALLPELARTPEEFAAASVAVGAMESLSLFAGPALRAGAARFPDGGHGPCRERRRGRSSRPRPLRGSRSGVAARVGGLVRLCRRAQSVDAVCDCRLPPRLAG